MIKVSRDKGAKRSMDRTPRELREPRDQEEVTGHQVKGSAEAQSTVPKRGGRDQRGRREPVGSLHSSLLSRRQGFDP